MQREPQDVFYNPNRQRRTDLSVRCGVIDTDTFKPCYSKIPPDQYKIICMQDVVNCNFDMRSDCMCNSLSLKKSYAGTCTVCSHPHVRTFDSKRYVQLRIGRPSIVITSSPRTQIFRTTDSASLCFFGFFSFIVLVLFFIASIIKE